MNPITRWCRVRWFRQAHQRIRDEHLVGYWHDALAHQVEQRKKKR